MPLQPTLIIIISPTRSESQLVAGRLICTIPIAISCTTLSMARLLDELGPVFSGKTLSRRMLGTDSSSAESVNLPGSCSVAGARNQ